MSGPSEPVINSGHAASPRRDVMLASVAGLMCGALAIPIAVNLRLDPRIGLSYLPVAGAVLFGAGIYAAKMLTRRVGSLFQFAKFGAIGVLNSGVDFGGLNLLMLATGVASGAGFLALKLVSVTLAVVNSYLWNKYWTFDGRGAVDTRREFVAFLMVTVVCVGLNVGAAEVIVNVVGAPRGVRPELWANFGALSAAGVTLFGNFFGYKFFVFTSPAGRGPTVVQSDGGTI